ncbi:uncharacterized protein BJX67DRAFT_364434 [Aspergillus lucknowensis]|uniref:Uncharacterized protein n=1 Tax=Aspergillus lucknowensis TaxID=176173 RepID=A0ABR4LF86_9EURO
MENTMVGVPTFNGGQAFAGVVGNNAFILYDHTCTIRGVYDPHDDGNCAIPYVIMENFLEYVLTVTEVNFDLGAGDFTFLYANGAYSIWENQHICTDISNGLQAVEACKAAFPLHGEPA